MNSKLTLSTQSNNLLYLEKICKQTYLTLKAMLEEDDDFEEDENEYGFENVSEEDWLTDVSPSTLFWFWTVELSWEFVLVALEEKIVILNNLLLSIL